MFLRSCACARRETGETVIRDRVQGEVTVANAQLDDMVLLRADGTPTYMLAVVVDDHDMGITHVIRGDDHLSNAFRQYQLYRALGWPVPEFAHVPLIHGPDGAKLSKRHGALGVDAYRDLGYLPEALCNYLLRLGWSHGDDEIISREQAIDWFDLDAVGRSPARFDFAKLTNLNGVYMRRADPARLLDLVMRRAAEARRRALLRRCARPARARHGELARARQDARRTGGERAVLCGRLPYFAEAGGRRLLTPAAIAHLRRLRGRPRAGLALDREPDSRPRRAATSNRRDDPGQAQGRRPAVARGAHRRHRLAADLRGDGDARPRGDLGKARFRRGNEGHDSRPDGAAGLTPVLSATCRRLLDDRREGYG